MDGFATSIIRRWPAQDNPERGLLFMTKPQLIDWLDLDPLERNDSQIENSSGGNADLSHSICHLAARPY